MWLVPKLRPYRHSLTGLHGRNRYRRLRYRDVTPVHSFLKSKATTRSRQILPCNIKPDLSQYLSLCRALLHNTPFNPLSRGETPPLTPFITNKKSAFQNSPLERGRGCVTPVHNHLKTKTVTEADRYRLAILSPIYSNNSAYAAPFSITHPLIPSQEGKYHTQNSHYQQENSISISPLERGWGCVTSAHSHLKTKTVTEADRYRLAILSPIYRNTSTYAAPFSVTHPFVPSQEGKHPHSNRSLPTRKQHLKTPLSRGAGGV